jgi:hypothetical protein
LASSDPDKAVEWLIANPGQAPNAVQQVASTFARTDPARAVSYSSRLTGDARVPWLRGVANADAQVDSRGALEWVEQLRGTPEYDEMAFAVLQSATPQDLAATTRLIESIGREDYQRMGIQSLATRWTNTDPAAAANWATILRSARPRCRRSDRPGRTKTHPLRRSGCCRSRPVRCATEYCSHSCRPARVSVHRTLHC